jgi:hypothetical protein
MLKIRNFHEGLSTVGEWQVVAWERHGICESAFNTAGERHGMFESAFSLSLPLHKGGTVSLLSVQPDIHLVSISEHVWATSFLILSISYLKFSML